MRCLIVLLISSIQVFAQCTVVGGQTNCQGPLNVTQTGLSGQIALFESSGTDSVTLLAPSSTFTSYILQFPNTAPTNANQVLMFPAPSGGISTAVWGPGGSQAYVAGGGTAQAQTVTFSPCPSSLSAGLVVSWLPVAANTGAAPTLKVCTLTAEPVTKLGTTALVADDLTSTAIAVAIYDGTEFQLQNPQTASSSGGGDYISCTGSVGISCTGSGTSGSPIVPSVEIGTVVPGLGTANTFSNTQTYTGVTNSAGASHSTPYRVGTGNPNTDGGSGGPEACSAVGEIKYQSDATAGSNTWACTTSGTGGSGGTAVWTLQGGASGSSTENVTVQVPVTSCDGASSSPSPIVQYSSYFNSNCVNVTAIGANVYQPLAKSNTNTDVIWIDLVMPANVTATAFEANVFAGASTSNSFNLTASITCVGAGSVFPWTGATYGSTAVSSTGTTHTALEHYSITSIPNSCTTGQDMWLQVVRGGTDTSAYYFTNLAVTFTRSLP